MTELAEPKINQTTTPEAYDSQIYSDFSEVAAFQAYEYLNGNKYSREDQKEKFISGEADTPQLDYPDINPEVAQSIESALLSMKQNILASEQNEVVKQAYRWKLNEKIAEARLLKAVTLNDMRKFKRYSEFIYGKPSAEVFSYTINSIGSNASKFINSDDKNLKEAAINLLHALPYMERPEIYELPDDNTLENARQNTQKQMGNILELDSNASQFDSVSIKNAFESALEKIGVNNWKIIIDEKTNRSGVSVNQDSEKIIIPQSRTVGIKKLTGLIAHEIGTHVTRRANGERSKLLLLGIGLDRYEPAEEGIATMREQSLSGKMADFSGIDGMLSIGLSLGIDGTPRNFRQTYDILEKYYVFKNLSLGKDPSEALTKAQDSAWNRSVRTFRGTDCKTPGVCFTKDIIYRNGSIGIWDLIKNPDEMLKFNIGKYDPTNKRHIWILEQLGITDQDLDSLE